MSHLRFAVLRSWSQTPGDLLLCIEYLDYVREARPRPGVESLNPARRTLHTLSCLLSNMSTIVNPSVGRVTAMAFCDDLGGCIRSLQDEVRRTERSTGSASHCSGRMCALRMMGEFTSRKKELMKVCLVSPTESFVRRPGLYVVGDATGVMLSCLCESYYLECNSIF